MCCRDQLIASAAQSIGPYTPGLKDARILMNANNIMRRQFPPYNLPQLLRPLAIQDKSCGTGKNESHERVNLYDNQRIFKAVSCNRREPLQELALAVLKTERIVDIRVYSISWLNTSYHFVQFVHVCVRR